MATWEQIIEDPAFGDLPTSAQADIRRDWYDLNVLPGLRETGIDEANLGLIRQKDITEYDNGQGYISSFASAAGRGAASTFTSAVQGVGALTGIESIEQAARDMDTAVTENLTVNPSMEKTNFAGNVLGNVAGFLVPGTLGMRVGKAAGMGAQLGGQIASNATILAFGAGGGAQTADQYGVQGPERTGMVLGNMATELLSERIPFGLGSELKAMGRLAGLGEDAAKRTGGFFSDVGQNAVEEMAANTGSNLVTSAFVPEGVQTPGIFEGNLEAAAGGAIGGAFFGGINLMAPAAPKPSEVIVEGATQRAMAGNDAEAAAEIPGAKLQPTATPQVPGAIAFDPTLSEQLAPAAGELPPPPGFAATTPPEAFPANLPQGLPAAAAVPGAVPEAFPAAEALPAAPVTTTPALSGQPPVAAAPIEAQQALEEAAYNEAADWDRSMKMSRSDEWFFGGKADADAMEGYRQAEEAGGDQLQAHGMAKEGTLSGGLRNLLGLLRNGLDPNRRGGILDTAGLVASDPNASGGATASGSAYREGPFTLVARPGENLSGDLSGLGAVVINQANAAQADSIRKAIQAVRPDLIVGTASELGSITQQLLGQPVAPVTAPAAAVPPITPAVAAQGATPSDLIDQTGRLTVEGAQNMIEAIQSLGLTTAPFVINNTGVAPGVIAPPAAGSTRPVDGTPTIFLNRERMTLDTPLHETTHLLTPTLFTEQRALYDVGAALLANSPLRQAVVDRYVTEAGMTMTDEQITEEAMVTGLANNGAEWLKAYAGNAKMTRAIKEFLAKVREWFDDLMYSKGFDPNMSLEQFYKKVNRQMLAGKLQQRATNAPVQGASLAATTPQDVLDKGHQMTKEEYAEAVSAFVKKPKDVFYIGEIEVVRNPSNADRQRMNSEVRSEYGRTLIGDDPTTRSTKDEFGNIWVWKANEGMHSQVEPGITKREGVEVNQNNSVPEHWQLVRKAIGEKVAVPAKVQAQYPQYKEFFQKTKFSLAPKDAAYEAAVEGRDWAKVQAMAIEEIDRAKVENDRMYKSVSQEFRDLLKEQQEDPNNPEVDRIMNERGRVRSRGMVIEGLQRYPNGVAVDFKKYTNDFQMEHAGDDKESRQRWGSTKRGAKVRDDESVSGVYESTGSGTLFRGITVADYERIMDQGFMDTDGRSAISPDYEGINLTPSTATAFAYFPVGEESVIVAINTDGLPLYQIGADDYPRSFDPIPADRIIAVSEPVVKDEFAVFKVMRMPGLMDENDQLVPLSKRVEFQLKESAPASSADTRFSLAPATPQDEAYKDAVKSGDVKAQQKLVDDAAEAAGVPSIGVNINDSDRDYTGMIFRGEKTVETRDSENNALKKYVGKRVAIVRTGIKKAKAMVMGYVTVGEPVRYYSEEEFAADFTRHRVTGGKFAFSGFKIGYPMEDVTPIEPYEAPEAPGQTVIMTRPIHEPVAYDENDKIILPSQRFDNSTRYSLAPAEQKVDAESVKAEFSPKTPDEQKAYDKASENAVNARNPYLAVAAVRMRDKKITVDRYAELIENLDPFTVKGAQKIATEAQIREYLPGAKDKTTSRYSMVMKPIEEGTLTECRIDIAAYLASARKGDSVHVITLHEPVKDTAKKVGDPISYVGAAKVINATFSTRAISGKGTAVDIAAGAGKFPLATVKGNYQAITSLPKDINDPKVWTEVGYNPIRSSGFVDVRSNKYVVGGSEAIMVGSRVFVKDPVFESRPTGFIGADTKFSLAPAVTKPSNVARNQAGTRVRVLMENQTYEGQTMDDARDQALSLYDDNVDKGFTVAQHMAFIQDLRTNAGRKYQDMTFGAYAGMYVRDLLDESTNPETDPMSQAFAKREVDRVAAMMAEEAAIGGRQAKAFDLYDRIANSPEMTVRQHEQLLPFDGKQNVKNDFDKAATTAREAMEGLANEAINTAPEDAMTSAINQQVAAVAKGEETSNVGEVVLDEVKPAETTEDLPAWFLEGQAALGAELSADIDKLTKLLQVYAYLKRQDGTYSLSAEERRADATAMINQLRDSGKTLEQALAETKKGIEEILSKFNKPKAKAKPKAAPVPKEAPPEGEIQDIVAARINRLLDKIVKPSTSPAKTRTDKEVLVDAIVSTMMAKAGLPADLKAGGDNVTLAFGLVVANPELAAQSVQAVYDLLQSDPASANITSSDKIRGFMQMMTGQSFADGKAYGEKQLNTVLKNELKRLKISVNDVAMDAALTGKTVEQLEAALRDPSRELSKVLSADALNKVVAAVTGEFRKTAAQRAAYLQQEEANAKVRRDMTADRKKAVQFAKKQVSDAKAAADRAKKAVLDAMAKWKKSEDKKVKKASESVRKAMAEELRILRKTALDTMATYKKAQDKLAMEAQRETRAAMAAEQRAIRKDRKFRLALNRKARKAMRRKLAKRGGFMIPLDQSEAEELLDQKPKTVLQYLAREYGFSLTDIIGMARDQDRQATLEAKVGKLAEALGLTKEQADKFMGPVIAEGMKHISEARKKDVSQRINRVLTPVIGKKKTQKTEAEKLIKLAEMGGLTADNVEKLLLNSKNAKEFTKEFRQELIDLIAQANDPHLVEESRDLKTKEFLDKIKAARGITVLSLLGEWTMSNIFNSILSTFKVNFVWGFIKAASDSGIFITISGPAAARADAIAKGVTPAPRLAVAKVLFRQWLRGYSVNMQHNAAFMWSEGIGKDESDITSQFANTGMEILARVKDAQIQWSNDGKVLPKSAQKVIKAMAAFGKYTRRTMVASDFINRVSAFEMSKVLEAVKIMQARGGAASTATIQREIDDALYGGSFKDAFAKANKQADDEIAEKKLGKAERGIRVGRIMDEMLGKNLGLTEKQTQEYLQSGRENAKRWSLSNQTEGIFGEISNLMLAATRKIPALKFSMPAVRMPIAAFSQTLDWTPYGFLRLYAIDKNNNETESFINYLFNSKGEYGNWNKPVGGVPAYRKTDLMAKATIGSLIMVGLFIKAALSFDEDEDEADFYITGLGPSDPAENKAWREKGNAPFTFRFNGGTGFRFQESPFYGMLAPIAAWSDAHRYGKPGEAESDRIAYAIGKTVSGFQEAVVMKNLSDILAGGSSYSADGQLRNWSKATSRLASNVLMPRLGGEINTILYGPQDQKALGWGGRALANVPFVPSFNNKPAQDFLGREIHTKREGMLGEIYPALAHRVLAPSLDDPILNFVAKMSPNFLATTRRFKDGTRVMDNYEFVRKWNAAAGVKIREYLTPERMASYERKLAKDKPDAQTEFNVEINKIRTAALRKFSEVQF